ncbi:SH2 domain-containing protein 3C [Portunus trituberculatus]|uniref:SH2 domain-containing protein 3C n=1 Tax=Portunus trituberculatus TaxID=210409 RepID=A0A5B7HXV3_PORTR|nr:SH2 domain-containing protein 3C [Portunus trituberculatus]
MFQIQRLTNTWHTVRQKFTDSAYNFESKLRSTLKSMNECTNPQAPNTTIPHLLPFLLLCERDLNDIYAMHRHVSMTCGMKWDEWKLVDDI